MIVNKEDHLNRETQMYDEGSIGQIMNRDTSAAPNFDMPSEGQRVAGPFTVFAKRLLKRGAKQADEISAPAAPEGPFTSTAEEPDLTGRTPDRNINLDNINTSEDVKRTIDDMAYFNSGHEEVRRSPMGHQATMEAAEAIDAITQITGQKPAQAWNAEQLVAARQLMVTKATEIQKQAKMLVENPDLVTEEDWVKFAASQEQYQLVQESVAGATAEAGRALNSMKIKVEGNDKYTAMDEVLKGVGGSKLMKQRAKVLADLDGKTPDELAKIVREASIAVDQDALVEIWVNGKLSNPATHAINTLSNTSMALYETFVVKPVAAGAGYVRQNGERITAEEVAAEAAGMVGAFGEAISLAGKMLKDPKMQSPYQAPSRLEMDHWNAVSSQNFGMEQGTGFAKAIDLLGDWVVRLPSRFIESEDVFFKTISYRKTLHAEAVRTARREGLTGDAYSARFRELVNSPTDEMKKAGEARSQLETFTNDPAEAGSWLGDVAVAATHFSARHPKFKFIAPFVRTPANIVQYSIENSAMAPLSAKWGKDYKAGGVKRDLAVARWGLGVMVLAGITDMYENGMITGSGPTQKADKDAMKMLGWQPNSIKMGDEYVAFNNLDPMGFTMIMLANAADRAKYAKNDAEATAIMMESTMALGEALMDKNFMGGYAEIMQLVSGEGGAKNRTIRYGNNIIAGFVPAIVSGAGNTLSSEGGMVERGDYNRFADGGYGAVFANLQKQFQNKIPSWKEDLPPQRNWKGEIVTASGGGTADNYFFLNRTTAKSDKATELLILNGVSPAVPPQLQPFILNKSGTGAILAMRAAGQEYRPKIAVDILNLDDNGGHVFSVFQEYVGKRRKMMIDEYIKAGGPARIRSKAGGDVTMIGVGSMEAQILEGLVAKGLAVGRLEFWRDYDKLADQHGWLKMDDPAFLEQVKQTNDTLGKEMPVPAAPQGGGAYFQ